MLDQEQLRLTLVAAAPVISYLTQVLLLSVGDSAGTAPDSFKPDFLLEYLAKELL